MKILPILLVAAILLTTTCANANLIASVDGQTVYDTDLNVTWLANANLAATNTFGLVTDVDLDVYSGVSSYGGSYIYSDGSMTWGGALQWIAAMNNANYQGFHDWHLSNALLPDATCSNQLGDLSWGSNCTGSEMGRLFYNELGGEAGQSIASTHNTNYDLFTNIQSDRYWFGTECALGSRCSWYFHFGNGSQSAGDKGGNLFVMAVHSGQVATVPLPATAWLLGSGLLGLISVARRKAA